MARTTFRLLPLLLAPTLLAGCATPYGGGSGYGGTQGNPYGGGYGAPQYPSDGRHAVGSVVDIDASRGRMLLSADSRYGPSQIEVAFTRQTRVFYQGQSYDPSAIERGDRLDVQLIEDGPHLYAGTIEVLRNVREGGAYGGYGGYGGAGPGMLEGAVGRVDLGSGTLELSSGGYAGTRSYVRFDRSTRFEYRGTTVSPAQLEPGDIVRADVRTRGSELYADRVVVVSSVRTR